MRTIDTNESWDAAWAAFDRRDRSWDGRVIGAVKTTGIYCKPSCPARRPKRENVEFFLDGESARAAGYRPCLRCKPDEVSRDREAVARAIQLIEQAEEPPRLGDLASAVGYAEHHFQRIFTRDTGVSPAAYARAVRARRAEAHLQEDKSVTEAMYDAGYAAPSRFYADAKERLGMTPSAWRDGGRGETIRYVVTDSPLGPLLVAATPKGICRLTFDEDESALRNRFPNADILPDDGTIAPWVAGCPRGDRYAAISAGAPDRCAWDCIPGSGVARAAENPARRNPQLCRYRQGGRRSERYSRSRHRQRVEPSCGARAMPSRHSVRRDARRLCGRA